MFVISDQMFEGENIDFCFLIFNLKQMCYFKKNNWYVKFEVAEP